MPDTPDAPRPVTLAQAEMQRADVRRAVAPIYRGARAQGATPDEAVQRCAEAFQAFGFAETARATATLERSREAVAPMAAEEAKGRGPIEDIVLRLADGRGVRVVPPGAVVVDPEGEIPEAVLVGAISAWTQSGPHTVRYERMEKVIRAALRAWPKGA